MNYHQIKTVFEHASSLGIKGEFARAKSVLKWLVVNTKGYDGLHYKSGISLACVYKKTLRRDSARKVYEYMIEYFKNSPRVLSLLYMDMAVLAIQNGELGEAEKSAKYSRDYDESEYTKLQKWYYLMLDGRYEALRGNYSESNDKLKKAWTCCEGKTIVYQKMQVASNIGDNYVEMGDIENGAQLVRNAYRIAFKIGAQEWYARNALVLMGISLSQDDVQAAKKYGKACFYVSYRNGYEDIVQKAAKKVGDYYKSRSNNEVADYFYKKAVFAIKVEPKELLRRIDTLFDTTYSRRKCCLRYKYDGCEWVKESDGAAEYCGKRYSIKANYRFHIGNLNSR